MATQSVTFDSNQLNTTNTIVQEIQHENIPQKDAKLYALAHASASAIPFVSYPTKKITILGQIWDTTTAALESRLDTFRGYFTGTNKNLDIQYGSSTRRYIATVNSITIDRPGGLTQASFQIEFMCTVPFGQDTATTTLLNVAGRTVSSYSDSVTFNGTAPFMQPIFTITYSALTGGTNAYVTVGNGSTGQQIQVQRNWTAGDVLVIDVSQKTVTVNGTSVISTGGFPEFAPGSQTLTYSDTLTTRNFTHNVVYTPRYM